MSAEASSLFKLPAEIRYMIFVLLISEPHTITFKFQDPIKWQKVSTSANDDFPGSGPLHALERSCRQLKDEIHSWLPVRPDLITTTQFGIINPKLTIFDFVSTTRAITATDSQTSLRYSKDGIKYSRFIRTAAGPHGNYYLIPYLLPSPTQIRIFGFWKECWREAGTNDIVAVTKVILSRLDEPEVSKLVRDLIFVDEKHWRVLLPRPSLAWCGPK
jgi:hypothetical protein